MWPCYVIAANIKVTPAPTHATAAAVLHCDIALFGVNMGTVQFSYSPAPWTNTGA